jgi:hypothetical protein
MPEPIIRALALVKKAAAKVAPADAYAHALPGSQGLAFKMSCAAAAQVVLASRGGR